MKSKLLLIVLLITASVFVSCQKEPFIVLSTETIEIPSQGGTIGFSFSTNREWVLTSSASWCKYETTPSNGEIAVVLTCGNNASYEARECVISIKAGEIEKTVTVIQAQKDVMDVDKSKYDASPDGETFIVRLSHNIDFEIVISVPWIERIGTKAYVTEDVSFKIDHNYTESDRQGEIKFTSKDKSISKAITISQKKKVWPVESVSLNTKTLTLKVDESKQLSASVFPDNATDKTVIWKSSNPDIVEVSSTGKIVAKRIGEAIITATAGDCSDQCVCSVTDYSMAAKDLSNIKTANCYIVPEKGVFKFKAVKGNSQQSVGSIDHVFVVWRTLNTTSAPSRDEIVIDPIYKDGYIVFSTGEKYIPGNALIAAADKNNSILWSWHIWVTDADLEGLKHTYANNAGVMMDRNLGALSATASDPLTIGLFYQWGRKDPFLASASLEEPVEMASDYSWPKPKEVFIDSKNHSLVEYSVQNPTTFISSGTGLRDWQAIYEGDINPNLWEKNKTIYDPCPPGWKVPEGGPDGIWAKAGIPTGGNLGYRGMTIDKQYCGKNAWYPAADARKYFDGTLNTGIGSWGRYWSCTRYYSDNPYLAENNDKWVFIFEFYSAETRIEGHTPVPAGAYSVRCCKE